MAYDAVGVMGGGSWGTTLAHLLGQNGHQVLLWLRDPQMKDEVNTHHRNSKYLGEHVISQNVTATAETREVAERCQVIIMAVPSGGFREVAYHLGNDLKGDHILISACKGLEAGTYHRMTTIIREETCARKIGVLSGPNLSAEIMGGSPSATTIASHYHEVVEKGIALLGSQVFKVYGNDDPLGVELGGVIKNVIAIAAGIIDGLGFGANTKAFLMTRGLHEMGKIGAKLGANPMTFTGLSGIGDIIVTCSSNLSRNYRVGYHLARGKKLEEILQEMKMVAEGVNTCRVLHDYSKEVKTELAIVDGVYDIVHNGKNIQEVIAELMARKAYFEIDSNLMKNWFVSESKS